MSALTVTEICNLAIARIGGNRINNFETSTTAEAVLCRLFFWQTAFSLMESFDWPFARGYQQLSQSTDAPDFEWTYKYVLPNDYLCLRHNYDEYESDFPAYRWEIAGGFLYTDEAEIQITYTRKIEETSEFTPMFIDVLVLSLSKKLIPAIAGTKAVSLTKEVADELRYVMGKTRTKHLQENNTTGRSDWHFARYGSIRTPTDRR